MDQSQVSSPATKIALAWGGVGLSVTLDWGQIAGFLASVYTVLMIGEWLWKHGLRSFCERRGWVAPRAPAAPKESDE